MVRAYEVLQGSSVASAEREDEGVEATLVDEWCFLGSAKGVAFRDPLIFVIYMLTQGIACIAVAQRLGHVAAHEHDLVIYLASTAR